MGKNPLKLCFMWGSGIGEGGRSISFVVPPKMADMFFFVSEAIGFERTSAKEFKENKESM